MDMCFFVVMLSSVMCCHSTDQCSGEDGKVFSVLFTVGISNIINLGKGQWLRNSHNSLFFCYIYCKNTCILSSSVLTFLNFKSVIIMLVKMN